MCWSSLSGDACMFGRYTERFTFTSSWGVWLTFVTCSDHRISLNFAKQTSHPVGVANRYGYLQIQNFLFLNLLLICSASDCFCFTVQSLLTLISSLSNCNKKPVLSAFSIPHSGRVVAFTLKGHLSTFTLDVGNNQLLGRSCLRKHCTCFYFNVKDTIVFKDGRSVHLNMENFLLWPVEKSQSDLLIHKLG